MTEPEWAAQLWPLLVLAARKRQVLTYTEVRKLTGIATRAVGHCLGPITRYCERNKLPALASIVVRKAKGLPGENFLNFAKKKKLTISEMQWRVFRHDWFKEKRPSPEQLEPFKDKRMVVPRGKS